MCSEPINFGELCTTTSFYLTLFLYKMSALPEILLTLFMFIISNGMVAFPINLATCSKMEITLRRRGALGPVPSHEATPAPVYDRPFDDVIEVDDTDAELTGQGF